MLANALVAAYVALFGMGELPAAEPEIRMPPARRSDHAGEHGQHEVVHAEHVELHLFPFVGGIERGHRAECRGACVRAEDGDGAGGQLIAERCPRGGIGEVDGAHLDGHAVLFAQPVGECFEHLVAAGRDDQVVPAAGEFDGQRLADVLRSTGDDRTAVRRWVRVLAWAGLYRGRP